jgi:Mlc titration factor MtfA (ptsG expression regulator)
VELSPTLWGLVPILLAVTAFVANFSYRRWRHKRIINQPFSTDWSGFLQRRLQVYEHLTDSERTRLHQMVHLFLEEKSFYGCAGLEVTDEIRVCIAAQACLLLLGRNVPLYPKLKAILVYPDAFTARRDKHHDDGTVATAAHHMLGESWSNGRIVLSWSDAVEGGEDFTDGHNVVLHEFAHQLDSASGAANGAPPLWRNSYQTWAAVFAANFKDLKRRVRRGKPTVMDPYGSTNEAEFFAVATETFFEKPAQLKKHRPELYEELREYYQVDPLRWQRE